MSNTYYYNYNGRRIEVKEDEADVRYNENTVGGHKSKSKGSINLLKSFTAAMVIFSLVWAASELSKVDVEMTKEEGTTVTQVDSGSAGVYTVTHGKRQHNLLDVINRAFADIKKDIDIFESEHSDGINDSISRGQ